MNIIKNNDEVIFYFRQNCKKLVKIQSNSFTSTPLGKINHDDIIGKRYGARVTLNKGDLILLKPDILLKTELLPRRTQILYENDISIIAMLLNLQKGSTVIECGTGSGMLTSIISNNIGNGTVYTYENDIGRYESFQKDVSEKGHTNIKSFHRDVTTEGFGVEGVDAVFLDMPSPEKVVKHMDNALKSGGRFVIFVISFEQVHNVLKCIKWAKEIKMIENVMRKYKKTRKNNEVVVSNDLCLHSGYLIHGIKG